MSDVVLESPLSAPVRSNPVAVKPISQATVLRSEWLKLRTLRSSWIGALAVLVAIVGFGVLAAYITGDRTSSKPGMDPVSIVLTGANFAVLLVSALGAIIGAREFGTGMIRTSLAAVPRRLPVLWGKLLSFVGLFAPVVIGGVVVAFTVGMAVLDSKGGSTRSWSDAGVARAVFGSGIDVLGLGIMGVALGMLLRSTAGAIGTVLGAVLFLPALATGLLPDSWNAVLKFLPSNAASAFTSVSPDSSLLSSGAGFAVFALWVLAAVVAAAVVLRRRDV